MFAICGQEQKRKKTHIDAPSAAPKPPHAHTDARRNTRQMSELGATRLVQACEIEAVMFEQG